MWRIPKSEFLESSFKELVNRPLLLSSPPFQGERLGVKWVGVKDYTFHAVAYCRTILEGRAVCSRATR